MQTHVTVSLSLARETAWDEQSSPVLVFDLFPLVESGHLSLGVSAARGHALLRPARELALSLLTKWTAPFAERIGGSFAFTDVARELGTSLFVSAGMRAPRVPRAGLSFEISLNRAVVSVDALNIDAALSERAMGVSEHLRLMLDADDALANGDSERARDALLEVLARAPKHAEAASALASIDALYAHRWEAALLTLSDSFADQSVTQGAERMIAPTGTLAAELYLRKGDGEKAARAAGVAATHEPHPELAARALAMAASLDADSLMAPLWLDEMVSLAPDWTRGRLLRMAARLRRGDLAGALGDGQHAEAAVRGARRSFDMCVALGRMLSDAGHPKDAGAYFERALTFAPDDAHALGALGTTLLARGLRKRGLQLLRESVDRGERLLQDMALSRLALSRAIAEATGDLPTSVSVLRGVADSSTHAPEARAAEARLLASLGELASASMAWARFAHLAQSRVGEGHVGALREALRFERDMRKDSSAAKHLGRIGLSMVPADPEFLAALGGGQATASLNVAPAFMEASPPIGADTALTTEVLAKNELAPLSPFPEMNEGEATQRVEDLTVDLRRNPNDTTVVAELVHHLTRLGRAMDLLALLSARLEEAPPELRIGYLPDTIRVYLELAAHARSVDAGGFEAQLYESAAKMLDDELAHHKTR